MAERQVDDGKPVDVYTVCVISKECRRQICLCRHPPFVEKKMAHNTHLVLWEAGKKSVLVIRVDKSRVDIRVARLKFKPGRGRYLAEYFGTERVGLIHISKELTVTTRSGLEGHHPVAYLHTECRDIERGGCAGVTARAYLEAPRAFGPELLVEPGGAIGAVNEFGRGWSLK